MTIPDTLSVGQAWDDDIRGTQRVITGLGPGGLVHYKIERRHHLRGVEWVDRACFEASFWAWVCRSGAVVR